MSKLERKNPGQGDYEKGKTIFKLDLKEIKKKDMNLLSIENPFCLRKHKNINKN